MSALHSASPLTVQVPCHGEAHELRYENGQLLAPDHPDVEGEMTLTALGGEATPCAEIVSTWHSAVADLRVLTLTERSAADRLQRPPVEVLFASAGPQGAGMLRPFVTPPAMPRPAVYGTALANRGWGGTRRTVPAAAFAGSMTSPASGKPDPLVRLLALSPALTQRLVTEVVTTWSARIARGEAPAAARPALSAALAGRATAVLCEWAGRPYDEIRVDMIDPGIIPTLDLGDRLAASLPFAWLGDVWLSGLSQLFGRFTLSATEHEDTITLDTVDSSMRRQDIAIHFTSNART